MGQLGNVTVKQDLKRTKAYFNFRFLPTPLYKILSMLTLQQELPLYLIYVGQFSPRQIKHPNQLASGSTKLNTEEKQLKSQF